MKKVAWVLAGTLILTACGGETLKPKLKEENDQAAYALGFRFGQQMATSVNDIDLDTFLVGLRDGAQGDDAKSRIDEDQLDDIIQTFQTRKMEEAREEQKQLGDANLSQGFEFREQNGAKEGVVTTDSGLQYEVLVAGDSGTRPGPESTVIAHYHGTLIDGTVFDSSVERGEPATFPLDAVIAGWQEALQLMQVGDKWRIVLPPDLAYGDQGVRAIGPNSTLIFEVELLEVQ